MSVLQFGIGSVAVFLMGIVLFAWLKEDVFEDNKQKIRKTWYGLFAVSVGAFIVYKNGITNADWKVLLLYVSMFVFVDIAVILTPSISKIWGAELNNVERTSQTLRSNIVMMKKKSEVFTDIIQNISPDLFKSEVWDTNDDYLDSLAEFLNAYEIYNDFTIAVYSYENNDITNTHQKIGAQFGIELDESQKESLKNQKSISINDQVAIISVNIIISTVIVIKTNKKVLLNEMDYMNVYNLSVIHSYFEE